MHLQTDAVIVLKPLEQAWRIIGNMIATPHALLQLLNMWRCNGELPRDFRMQALFEKLRSMSMQAKHVQIFEDDEAWYMAFPQDMPYTRARFMHYAKLLGGGHVQDCELQNHEFIHADHGKTDLHVPCDVPAKAQRCVIPTPAFEPVVAGAEVEGESELRAFHNCVAVDSPVAKKAKTEVGHAELNQTGAKVQRFLLPREYGVLDVHSSVRPHQLQNLWYHPIWLQERAKPPEAPVSESLEGLLIAYPITTIPQHLHLLAPITIISLLYRTWGKACCTQVLRHWSQTMPREIAGFIIEGNMNVHMIRAQHSLELSQAEQQEATGGLTLDLTKAFNLIARAPSARALAHAGVPLSWVRQWSGSQQALSRTWEVASQSTPPRKVTTGAPEGDTWSVLCMLSLSYVWICTLRQRCSPQISPTACADNLGWMTGEQADHLIVCRPQEEA